MNLAHVRHVYAGLVMVSCGLKLVDISNFFGIYFTGSVATDAIEAILSDMRKVITPLHTNDHLRLRPNWCFHHLWFVFATVSSVFAYNANSQYNDWLR